MYTQNCTHHGPQGSGGATRGKTIFSYVYIEKIFFSRTSMPISMKLGINYPWVKRILNDKNGKLRWVHLKIFFSRTTEPEELIFT
jgi:hypothetical protein